MRPHHGDCEHAIHHTFLTLFAENIFFFNLGYYVIFGNDGALCEGLLGDWAIL